MSIYKSQLSIPRPEFLGGSNWDLVNLNDITIIFGRNGSGKSHLLRGLKNIDQNFHYASPERGGEINSDPGIAQQEFEPSQRAGKRVNNFQPTYHQEVMSRIGAYLQKRGNSRLKNIKMSPEEIEDFIQKLLPNFTFTITGTSNPFQLSRIYPVAQEISSVTHLSSGEAQLLTLALDLLTISAIWELEKTKDRIFIIDEPDTHLHPELQQRLASFLIEVSLRFKCQLFIATHSTTLLSALGYFGEDKTSIIYINNNEEDQRSIKFDETLEIISSCLGGHVLMGPLFGFPILLVEGQDDYTIWGEAVRQHKLKVAIIPCNGSNIKKYRKTLDHLLSSILEKDSRPTAFCLKDKDNTNPVNHNQSASAVPIIKLACFESENLYISDEVLESIGTNWNDVSSKIRQLIKDKHVDGRFLKPLLSSDRKTSDIKVYIKKLQSFIDEEGMDWRIRVGKVIGAGKPSGQLAEFLGTAVIDALWPDSESLPISLNPAINQAQP